MVAQNGVPFHQSDKLKTTWQRMNTQFKDMCFYVAAVPTYYGGFMSFSWGTDGDSRDLDSSQLQKRFDTLKLNTRYYNPGIHKAAFVLPGYIVNALTLESS